MHKNTVLLVIIAALGGFIAGFWLANSINRSVATTTPAAQPGVQASPADSDLTEQEIRQKIAEADASPGNLAFQRDLGVSLYRYAAMKQTPGLLADAARILERAASLDPKDFDVMVALGNAYFDIGYYEDSAPSFQQARDVYGKALTLRPNDPDVSTDLGITYFLQQPPDHAKAAAELEKVAAANPRHERSRTFLIRTYVKQSRTSDAEKALSALRNINPNNTALAELSTLVQGGGTGGR